MWTDVVEQYQTAQCISSVGDKHQIKQKAVAACRLLHGCCGLLQFEAMAGFEFNSPNAFGLRAGAWIAQSNCTQPNLEQKKGGKFPAFYSYTTTANCGSAVCQVPPGLVAPAAASSCVTDDWQCRCPKPVVPQSASLLRSSLAQCVRSDKETFSTLSEPKSARWFRRTASERCQARSRKCFVCLLRGCNPSVRHRVWPASLGVVAFSEVFALVK